MPYSPSKVTRFFNTKKITHSELDRKFSDKKQQKFLNNNLSLKNLTIQVAGAGQILKSAYRPIPYQLFGKRPSICFGRVTTGDTINYKTFAPALGGLMCPIIFGPLKSWHCLCNRGVQKKTKKDKVRGVGIPPESLRYIRYSWDRVFCSQCFVEWNEKTIRRYQMGYIRLHVPIVHTWLFNSRPNILRILLNETSADITALIFNYRNEDLKSCINEGGEFSEYFGFEEEEEWEHENPPPLHQIQKTAIESYFGIKNETWSTTVGFIILKIITKYDIHKELSKYPFLERAFTQPMRHVFDFFLTAEQEGFLLSEEQYQNIYKDLSKTKAAKLRFNSKRRKVEAVYQNIKFRRQEIVDCMLSLPLIYGQKTLDLGKEYSESYDAPRLKKLLKKFKKLPKTFKQDSKKFKKDHQRQALLINNVPQYEKSYLIDPEPYKMQIFLNDQTYWQKSAITNEGKILVLYKKLVYLTNAKFVKLLKRTITKIGSALIEEEKDFLNKILNNPKNKYLEHKKLILTTCLIELRLDMRPLQRQRNLIFFLNRLINKIQKFAYQASNIKSRKDYRKHYVRKVLINFTNLRTRINTGKSLYLPITLEPKNQKIFRIKAKTKIPVSNEKVYQNLFYFMSLAEKQKILFIRNLKTHRLYIQKLIQGTGQIGSKHDQTLLNRVRSKIFYRKNSSLADPNGSIMIDLKFLKPDIQKQLELNCTALKDGESVLAHRCFGSSNLNSFDNEISLKYQTLSIIFRYEQTLTKLYKKCSLNKIEYKKFKSEFDRLEVEFFNKNIICEITEVIFPNTNTEPQESKICIPLSQVLSISDLDFISNTSLIHKLCLYKHPKLNKNDYFYLKFYIRSLIETILNRIESKILNYIKITYNALDSKLIKPDVSIKGNIKEDQSHRELNAQKQFDSNHTMYRVRNWTDSVIDDPFFFRGLKTLYINFTYKTTLTELYKKDSLDQKEYEQFKSELDKIEIELFKGNIIVEISKLTKISNPGYSNENIRPQEVKMCLPIFKILPISELDLIFKTYKLYIFKKFVSKPELNKNDYTSFKRHLNTISEVILDKLQSWINNYLGASEDSFYLDHKVASPNNNSICTEPLRLILGFGNGQNFQLRTDIELFYLSQGSISSVTSTKSKIDDHRGKDQNPEPIRINRRSHIPLVSGSNSLLQQLNWIYKLDTEFGIDDAYQTIFYLTNLDNRTKVILAILYILLVRKKKLFNRQIQYKSKSVIGNFDKNNDLIRKNLKVYWRKILAFSNLHVHDESSFQLRLTFFNTLGFTAQDFKNIDFKNPQILQSKFLTNEFLPIFEKLIRWSPAPLDKVSAFQFYESVSWAKIAISTKKFTDLDFLSIKSECATINLALSNTLIMNHQKGEQRVNLDPVLTPNWSSIMKVSPDSFNIHEAQLQQKLKVYKISKVKLPGPSRVDITQLSTVSRLKLTLSRDLSRLKLWQGPFNKTYFQSKFYQYQGPFDEAYFQSKLKIGKISNIDFPGQYSNLDIPVVNKQSTPTLNLKFPQISLPTINPNISEVSLVEQLVKQSGANHKKVASLKFQQEKVNLRRLKIKKSTKINNPQKLNQSNPKIAANSRNRSNKSNAYIITKDFLNPGLADLSMLTTNLNAASMTKNRKGTFQSSSLQLIQARTHRERKLKHIWLKNLDSENKMLNSIKYRQGNNFNVLLSQKNISACGPLPRLKSRNYESLLSQLANLNIPDLIQDLNQRLNILKLDGDNEKNARPIDGKHPRDRISWMMKKQKQILRRIKLLKWFLATDTKLSSLILTVIPVLPPDLRPIMKLSNGLNISSDLNDLYKRIMAKNLSLENQLSTSGPLVSSQLSQRNLYDAVGNLFDISQSKKVNLTAQKQPVKSLIDILKGKPGRFRQNLLGKRVDYSGRSVITVNPNLKLHQCGLPKPMAATLFKPFLIQRLIQLELANTKHESEQLICKNYDFVWYILISILENNSVILNRAPTLHRLGIQAFDPVLIEGLAIQLHPLVCSAFNADFDGDQMGVHIPLSWKAQIEAKLMLLSSNNWLSPGDNQPTIIPSQDMVLGSYYLTIENLTLLSLTKEIQSFGSLHDVVRAYEQDQIHFHAFIWLRWNGIVGNEKSTEEPIEIRVRHDGSQMVLYDRLQVYKTSENKTQIQYVRTTVGRAIFNNYINAYL